jgi:hypothetical protein
MNKLLARLERIRGVKMDYREQDTHLDVVRRYMLVWNSRELVGMRELFTPDAIIEGTLARGCLDEVLPVWRELAQAFRPHRIVESIVVQEAEVVARYTEQGVFVGPFRGRLPTGRRYELVTMDWFAFEGEKISRLWRLRDYDDQARQVKLR